MSKCKMILPKLWLQAIPRYWDKKVPSDYPETGVEFSTYFESKKVQDAVNTMESALNTEESIVKEEMITDGNALGSYVGTYDVSGTPGESVLLSPEKIDPSASGVLAFHYNKESSNWDQIKDVEIKDGYAYGKIESFSPIAVFTLKKAPYLDNEIKLSSKGYPTFVCNGVECTFKGKDNENNTVTDADCNTYEVPVNAMVVAGTVDGTDLDFAHVTFTDNAKIAGVVFSGSVSEKAPVNVKKAVIDMDGYGDNSEELQGTFGAAGYNCTVEKAVFNIKNSKFYAIGGGNTIVSSFKPVDSNNIDGGDVEYDTLNLSSPCKSKDTLINIENSEADTVYGGLSSGSGYTYNAVVNIKGGKFKVVCTGGSNGVTTNDAAYVEDTEIATFIHTNRGHDINAKSKITNSTIENLWLAADNLETDTGLVESVECEVVGGKVTLNAGNYNGEAIDISKAKEIVKKLSVSKSTDLTYGEGAEEILKDIINK